MKENISVGTVIRTVCLLLALVNLTLETFGKSIIPISDEQVSELLELPLHDPLIYLELTSILMNGQVLEFVETYANPQNYQVMIHSRRKW